MAYDGRYRTVFLIASSLAAAVAITVTETIDYFISRAIDLAAVLFEPARAVVEFVKKAWRVIAEPSASLAHITRYLVTTGRMRFAQTRSFIQRAELHPAYSAGHFDPGRQPT